MGSNGSGESRRLNATGDAANGAMIPSRADAASSAVRVIPACEGATRSISSHRSDTLSTPRLPPSRSASSAAIIQSGQH
jgi:hypothetical protein